MQKPAAAWCRWQRPSQSSGCLCGSCHTILAALLSIPNSQVITDVFDNVLA